MSKPESAQEVFDIVVGHLFKQGRKAADVSDSSYTCLYRTQEGLTCAVGCLISEGEYSPHMENGYSVRYLIDARLWEKDGDEDVDTPTFPQVQWMAPYVNLLMALQAVHDGDEAWKSSAAMRSHLVPVARAFDLVFFPAEHSFSDR